MCVSVSARTNGRARMRDSKRIRSARDNRQVDVRGHVCEYNLRIRLRTHRTIGGGMARRRDFDRKLLTLEINVLAIFLYLHVRA